MQNTKQDCGLNWKVASASSLGELCTAKSTTDWPQPEVRGLPWRGVAAKGHAQEKGAVVSS